MRLVAVIQISRLTSRACHNDSAAYTASCVLPDAPSQSGDPAGGRPGTSATVAPGTSAAARLAAVSGRRVKPSASGGIAPQRTGVAGGPPAGPAGPLAGTWLIT